MAVAGLSIHNPYYLSREVEWKIMRDAYGGERYIKESNQIYLPATASMLDNGMGVGQDGWAAYQSYRGRSVYHELVKPSLMAMLGVMHRKPPTIKLPKKMEPMLEKATFNGESLHWLLQKINEQQMLVGRIGLFLDVRKEKGPNELPYIVTYNAEQIINWDSSKVGDDEGYRTLEFVVLDESDMERKDNLAWTRIARYRVLAMAGAMRPVWDTKFEDDTYIGGKTIDKMDIAAPEFTQPSIGGTTLDHIPFVFVGPRDLVPEPDAPVLMPIARLALAIYRTEADYRQALFMQGQDTLVVIGQQADAAVGRTRMGALGSIDLPMGGDAKFIGAQSQGIQYLENAIQNDLIRAAQLGAQLLSERGNEAEAASALNIRVASRTATLTTVAITGAAGLERILKDAAILLGCDEKEVSVKANLDFAEVKATAQDIVYLMTGKKLGAPLSLDSIHEWLQRHEFTSKTRDDEQAAIDKEDPIDLGLGTPGQAGVPTGGNNFVNGMSGQGGGTTKLKGKGDPAGNGKGKTDGNAAPTKTKGGTPPAER